MNKENLLFEIERFILRIKKDYQNNIISGFQFELLYKELSNLIKNSINTDFLILATKFDTIKSIYLIMK